MAMPKLNAKAKFLGIAITLAIYPQATSAAAATEDGEVGNDSALIVLTEQAEIEDLHRIGDRKQRRQVLWQRLTEVARSSQPALVKKIESLGLEYRRYYIHNMIAVFGATPEQLEFLSAEDNIGQILPNPLMRMQERRADPIELARTKEVFADQLLDATGIGPNISAIKADRVWQNYGFRGEGIVIAGQDTGYQWDHPALKASYRGWNGQNATHDYHWHDAIHGPGSGSSARNKCGYNVAEPCDDSEHGTHTMGTMVGDDGGSNKIGVAPRAKWIGCRNMDEGWGRPSTYIECFEYFLAPYPYGGDPTVDGNPDMAPDVINNSWGCPSQEGCVAAETLPVLKALQAAGILVVASAGNEGPGCSTIGAPPAMHSEYNLSIGAVNNQGQIANFSSRGPSVFDQMVGPHVVAPGVNVRSAIPGNGYSGFFWSGTSMAGPHVAALVALMWQANSSLRGNIHATREMIQRTATPKTSKSQSCGGVSGQQIPNNTYGWGMVDAEAAVRAALSF